MKPNEFIAKIGEFARQDMQKSGILASLTIAQAIVESGWGKYDCGGNNLFGIKGEYNGNFVECPTKEYYNGQYANTMGYFRKYPSWAESLQDHSDFIKSVKLGDGSLRYKAVIGETNYKKACQAIKDAGYATSPTYAQTLINIIEQYNLYEFDKPQEQPAQHIPQQKSINDIAQEVLKGNWGNGAERKAKLEQSGYNYSEVQNIVNQLCGQTPQPTLQPQSQAQRTYTVKAGDSYWGIAQSELKNGSRWGEIKALNGNREVIHPNDILKIPQF